MLSVMKVVVHEKVKGKGSFDGRSPIGQGLRGCIHHRSFFDPFLALYGIQKKDGARNALMNYMILSFVNRGIGLPEEE